MRIALATCENLPDWEVDDRPLHAAFEARGVSISRPVWSDPGVDWSSFDACLIRTTWDYQERRDAFLDWVQRVAIETMLFNRPSIIRWNTHKSYLRDLAVKGVRTVPTIWLAAGAPVDLAALLVERGWQRGFLKPAIGATSRETMRFEIGGIELDRAQEHVDRLIAREDMLLQPYLPSVESEGEYSAIFIDGEITHTIRKIPVAGDYRVQDDFGAHDEPHEFTEDELIEAQRAIDVAGDGLLYGRTDFLRDERGNLCLTELELVEPSLFFRHGPHAAERLAEALCARVEAAGMHR